MKIRFFTPLITLLLSLCILSSCSSEKKPKYIFYFIGDGYGLAQSAMAENYLDAVAKDSSVTHLQMLKMPVFGTQTTYSNSSFVTCSSASGTALATGVKTNNGMLGVTPDNKPLKTIAEKFHNEGFNVGIISTVGLNHATPAAFYASAEKRSNYNEISKQLAESGFEFFGGGSLISSDENPEIWDYVKEKGYTVSNNFEEINNHKLADGKLIAISSKIGAGSDIPYYVDQPNHNMHLPYFVDKMINLFQESDKGFFAMIEAGKIDWSSHGNDAAGTLFECLQLDKAYEVAYKFYLEHPDETLIFITADHETGGLGIGQNSLGYKFFPELMEKTKVSGDGFNAIVDQLAKDNASLEEVYDVIEEQFGFNSGDSRFALSKKDSARIEMMYHKRFSKNNILSSDMLEAYDLTDKSTLSNTCLTIMNEKTGTGWTTRSHTGITVPVRAIGAGAEVFNGFYDNTDIPKKLNSFTQTPDQPLN